MVYQKAKRKYLIITLMCVLAILLIVAIFLFSRYRGIDRLYNIESNNIQNITVLRTINPSKYDSIELNESECKTYVNELNKLSVKEVTENARKKVDSGAGTLTYIYIIKLKSGQNLQIYVRDEYSQYKILRTSYSDDVDINQNAKILYFKTLHKNKFDFYQSSILFEKNSSRITEILP